VNLQQVGARRDRDERGARAGGQAPLSVVGAPPSPRAWAGVATTSSLSRGWTLIVHGGVGAGGECLSDLHCARVGSRR
jgi:hypothetical protein